MNYKGIAFFDMDGVLANCGHRLHFIEEGDYDSFYAAENIMKDSPIIAGLDLAELFSAQGYKIVLITSRRESCRSATLRWLEEVIGRSSSPLYCILAGQNLYMRSDGDLRKSWEVKKDLLQKAIEENKDEFSAALCRFGCNYFVDDYPNNCKMVKESFPYIQPIIFGLGRINDNSNIAIE